MSEAGDKQNGQLERVRRDFEEWRQRRKSGERIPETLWGAAASLTKEEGLYKTARTLHLDYCSLKKRANQKEAKPRRRPRAKPQFWEIPMAAGSGPAECVVEIEAGQGSRIRVELRSAAAIEAVARALWSGR